MAKKNTPDRTPVKTQFKKGTVAKRKSLLSTTFKKWIPTFCCFRIFHGNNSFSSAHFGAC